MTAHIDALGRLNGRLEPLIARARAWWDAARPVARGILRRLGVVSLLGWALLGCAIAALSVGLTYDWVELIAVAGVLAVAVVVAVPFLFGRVAYAVRVELASARVTVGERAVGRLVVRSDDRHGSAATTVELPVGRARAAFRMPRLPAGSEHDELFTIPTSRRAVLTLGPVTSVRTDPLGLVRRTAVWTEPVELFVHPHIVRLDAETSGFMRDLEGLPTRDLADDDVSFHALREYVPGDDLRHVHWKSTARTEKLMIRQFEQTRRSHLVIVLSRRAVDYADDAEFELAVSIAGSIGASALHDGRAVTLLSGDESRGRALPTATRGRLLDRLSGLELAAGAPGPRELVGVVRTASAASVVIFVTGSTQSLPALRRAQTRLPSATRAACVRAETGGELGRRVVGDLVAVSVPALDTLRLALRAVAA